MIIFHIFAGHLTVKWSPSPPDSLAQAGKDNRTVAYNLAERYADVRLTPALLTCILFRMGVDTNPIKNFNFHCRTVAVLK